MADDPNGAPSDDDGEDEPNQQGNKGPAKRLALRLTKPKGEDPVDTTPYGVSVSEPKKPAPWMEPIPYHQEDEEPFPPGKADCFLQVWELDKYAKAGKYLSKADNDYGEATNRLVGSIPGCVILKKVGQKRVFLFRALGTKPVPERSFTKHYGRITLKLKNTDEEDVEIKVNLPEYEGILELAVCLAPTAAAATLKDVSNASGVTFVHNVHASVHKQLRDRGGIAVSCISKYDEPVSNNDKEMEKQAKQILSNMATFKVEDGKLRLGYYKIKGYTDIPALLDEVRKKAKEELNLDAEPKVTALFMFAHGIRQKLNLNTAGWRASGTLSAKTANDFVSKIKPHVASPLVIPLFACNNGRGERAHDTDRMQGKTDKSYGLALACEIPGYDSLGWHISAELEKAGIKNTVWAHTTTGHTTRNCRLRVFSSWGTGDFASCLYGGRKLEKKTRSQYGLQTNYSFKNQKREVAQQKLANANVIRAISTHSALYLDWSWLPGSTAGKKDPFWNDQAAAECAEVVKKFKDLMTRTDVAPEEWAYEDAATKAHITGVNAEGGEKDPKFSKNFSWSELKGKGSPFRLSVKLLTAVQASLTPNKSSVAVKELIEHGDGMVLRAGSTSARDKILKEAKALKGLGLKTVAALGKREIVLNVSGVTYDAGFTYIHGGPADAYLTPCIRMGDFGAKPPAKINRQLLLLAQELLEQVSDAKLAGIDPLGEALYLQSSSPELERLAEEMEAGGRIEEACKTGEGLVKIAAQVTAAIAP